MAGLFCGIVGLPNVGKSTLFNALTSKQVPASNYPFCTIDPNVGMVEVYDHRLEVLAQLSHSAKIVYAATQFVDIAGLVEGASKGEGLGNAFLSHIRDTDALAHVVRCFESEDVIHVKGRINPIEDIEIINLELILADLASCESNCQKVEKQLKTRKDLIPLHEALLKVQEHLNQDQPVRALSLTPEEKLLIDPYRFLTAKKMLYVCNIAENEISSPHNPYVDQVKEYAAKEQSEVCVISANIENEIAQLPPAERKTYLESLGLEESGLDRLIRASFKMLGLITFLTSGEMESRAWTLEKGATAVEAAGKIHTDIQKGFVRAEVISYDDYVACGGRVKAKESGKARAEGKEYIVQDGDVILFLHH